MSLEEIIKNKPITNNYISPRDTLLKEENYFLNPVNERMDPSKEIEEVEAVLPILEKLCKIGDLNGIV